MKVEGHRQHFWGAMVDMVNSFALSESFDPVHVMVDMVNSFAVMRAFASTSYNSPGGKRRGGGVLAVVSSVLKSY